jgi:peptide/nickel transport system substrate-binding protein
MAAPCGRPRTKHGGHPGPPNGVRNLQDGPLTRLLAAVAVAASAAFVACGDQSDEGGEIEITQTAGSVSLDPGAAYRHDPFEPVEANEPLWLVYTPLLSYRHVGGESGSELIPGLAGDLPEISNDGRTYTLTLRDGLTYSDETPVRARDFEHTIQRLLTLGSNAAAFYENVEGVRDYLSAGDPDADISGIAADDESREITITLVEPDASFANVLAMWPAGLVPSATPFRDLTGHPPPGVGPYEITESVPGRSFVMEKAQTFGPLDIPDIPTGNVDKISVHFVDSLERQAQDVLDNKLDYMQDPPPANLSSTIADQAEDRYEEHTGPSTSYFFLNERTAPFDDPKVREAVNYGIDRPALAELYADRIAPGCSLLPPGTPGYEDTLDTTECPYGDPEEPPQLRKARRLIKEAGARRTKVTVWGAAGHPSAEVTKAYAETLTEIGLDAVPKVVAADEYQQLLDGAGEPQTGLAVLFQDFPHPLNAFSLVDGNPAAPTGRNLGNVDDPVVNEEIDRLSLEPELDSVLADWSTLDSYVVSPPQSYLAAFGHNRRSTFFSERLSFDSALFHPVYGNDYSSFVLKEGER